MLALTVFASLQCHHQPAVSCGDRLFEMVRAVGIEPTSQAWEARILPMYYTRRPENAAIFASCRTR